MTFWHSATIWFHQISTKTPLLTPSVCQYFCSPDMAHLIIIACRNLDFEDNILFEVCMGMHIALVKNILKDLCLFLGLWFQEKTSLELLLIPWSQVFCITFYPLSLHLCIVLLIIKVHTMALGEQSSCYLGFSSSLVALCYLHNMPLWLSG